MTLFSKARVVQLSPPTPHVPQNLFHGGTFGECDEVHCWWCTSTGKYQCELGTVGTALEVAVDVVGGVEGAVGGGRGALYQLVCHDCSPAGWNFDISYSPSITKVRVNIFLDFPGMYMWVRKYWWKSLNGIILFSKNVHHVALWQKASQISKRLFCSRHAPDLM